MLDYGCGHGWQAVAMELLGAKSVTGVDINPDWRARAELLAEAQGCNQNVRFLPRVPEALLGTFDIALSLNSFEPLLIPPPNSSALRKPPGRGEV